LKGVLDFIPNKIAHATFYNKNTKNLNKQIKVGGLKENPKWILYLTFYSLDKLDVFLEIEKMLIF